MISYALAFLAAMVNAVGDVLNRKASREAPANLAFKFGLFADLLHRPAWLMAAALMPASFVLAAAALGTGQLAAVQLIVILELPLTLVGSVVFLGGRLPLSEWAAICAMTAGVIGLLVLLDPRPGPRNAISPAIWLFGSAANAGVVAGLYIAAKAQRGAAAQAALLGLASGFGYGLTAAFIKGMTTRFNASGVGGVPVILAAVRVRGRRTYLYLAAAERLPGGDARGRATGHHAGRSRGRDALGHESVRGAGASWLDPALGSAAPGGYDRRRAGAQPVTGLAAERGQAAGYSRTIP